MKEKSIIPEVIEQKIYLIRGQRVMLDKDLAELYGVPTGRLNEQVKRNIKRFPTDFMFQLTREEVESLRSQFAILKIANIPLLKRGKHIKYLPYAFAEQGVAMLSSILNSERAIQVNVAIMRAFVRLRQILATNKELANQLNELEQKIENHDSDIKVIFEAIRQLMTPPREPEKPPIGFNQPVKSKKITLEKSGKLLDK